MTWITESEWRSLVREEEGGVVGDLLKEKGEDFAELVALGDEQFPVGCLRSPAWRWASMTSLATGKPAWW